MSQNEGGRIQSRKEQQAMNRNVPWKDILLIIAVIYFLSPIDFIPGLLTDDFAALVNTDEPLRVAGLSVVEPLLITAVRVLLDELGPFAEEGVAHRFFLC